MTLCSTPCVLPEHPSLQLDAVSEQVKSSHPVMRVWQVVNSGLVRLLVTMHRLHENETQATSGAARIREGLSWVFRLSSELYHG